MTVVRHGGGQRLSDSRDVVKRFDGDAATGQAAMQTMERTMQPWKRRAKEKSLEILGIQGEGRCGSRRKKQKKRGG